MNYYPFHIGDYRSDTSHLSLVEHGIYRQLIDWYYLDEHCIPAETNLVFRRLQARTDDEKAAVKTILDEFFRLTPEGYSHSRCDAEIAKYQSKAEVARSNGKSGGRPKKTDPVISGLPQGSGSKANQEPLTTNQEPPTIVDSVPIGTGGKPPMLTDPKEIIFGYGLSMLVNAGTPEKQARSFLGGLAKYHGEPELIDKLRECAKARPLQPLEWLAAALPPTGPKPKLNKQEALEASNREVARRFIEKLESEHEQE